MRVTAPCCTRQPLNPAHPPLISYCSYKSPPQYRRQNKYVTSPINKKNRSSPCHSTTLTETNQRIAWAGGDGEGSTSRGRVHFQVSLIGVPGYPLRLRSCNVLPKRRNYVQSKKLIKEKHAIYLHTMSKATEDRNLVEVEGTEMCYIPLELRE